jgi:methyl coenzyme M reductase subunit C
MLMSDSIGGNAKTLMFVNCSPASYNISESNSSLTFALRCKDIKNNTAPTAGGAGAGAAAQLAQLNVLKKELKQLKREKGAVAANHGSLARPT